MISGASRGKGGFGLGKHLSKDFGMCGESRGLVSDDISGQVSELTKIASRAKHSQPLYHCFARPEEGAKPWTPKDFDKYWSRFEKEFKLEKQPFSTAIHDEGGHQHRVYSLVKPSGSCIRMDNDFARREKIGRLVEFERGDRLIKGAHNKSVISYLRDEHPEAAKAFEAAGIHEGPKPVASLSPKERHIQERTKITKSEIAALASLAWSQSDDGQSFQNALSEQGLTLARGDKCPLIIDQSGTAHSVQRLLDMDARTRGEPTFKAADISQRLGGMDLPSLKQAKAEILNPVPMMEGPSQEPTPPTVTPPDGGNQSPAFQSEGLQRPLEASAGKVVGNDTPQKSAPSPSLGGGGGGGPSHSQTTPLASMENTDGPGEAPGHNASPEERAKYLARLHAYQERREKQSQQFAKAMADASAKPSTTQPSAGGDNQHGSIQHETKATSGESPFWKAFAKASRQAAAKLEFEAAIRELTEYGHNHIGSAQIEVATGERSEGGREIREGGGIAGRHEDSQGIGRTEPNSSSHRFNGDDGRSSGTDREKSIRNIEQIAEEARFKNALAFCDTLRLSTAIKALKPKQPDPLEGLSKSERFEKLREWKSSLYEDYKNQRDSDNELRQDGWKYHVSQLKEETDKLKAVLAKHRGSTSREMYLEAFDLRTQMRSDLIEGLKFSSKSYNKENTFERFLQECAFDNPKAEAVFDAMIVQRERKLRIQETLSSGLANIEKQRTSAPASNPRDRDTRLARHIAVERAFERYHQQQDIIKLNEERYLEISKLKSWWPWHPINKEMKNLIEENQRRHVTLDSHKPKRNDLDDAIHRAVSIAEFNQKQFSKWEASTGQTLDRRESLILGIQESVENGDPKIKSLLADGKLEEAIQLQAKREAEEQRNLDERHKIEMGNVVHINSQNQNVLVGPRIR